MNLKRNLFFPDESGRSSAVLIATALLASTLLFPGCSSRSFTKPRSQIVQESRGKGLVVPSVAEERTLFFADQEASDRRLTALVRSRSGVRYQSPHYRIGPADEVEVNVFDVPELNVTAPVRQSGFLTLPLVGAVRAVGKTEQQLQEELVGRLQQFVRTPEVSVSVAHYASQKVAVMGAVNTPGSYPLKKGQNSLVELISQAGGISEDAGAVINFVPVELSGLAGAGESEMRAQFGTQTRYRGGRLPSTVIEIGLDDVLGTGGGLPLEIPVRGGDMIVIPAAGQVMVEGEVEDRGAFTLGRRMSLLGALAAAGGITYSAKIDEVEVIRTVNGTQKRRLVVDLESILSGNEIDVRLRSGDLVRVPSDSGRRLRQDTFESISSLINVGFGGSVRMGGG